MFLGKYLIILTEKLRQPACFVDTLSLIISLTIEQLGF